MLFSLHSCDSLGNVTDLSLGVVSGVSNSLISCGMDGLYIHDHVVGLFEHI